MNEAAPTLQLLQAAAFDFIRDKNWLKAACICSLIEEKAPEDHETYVRFMQILARFESSEGALADSARAEAVAMVKGVKGLDPHIHQWLRDYAALQPRADVGPVNAAPKPLASIDPNALKKARAALDAGNNELALSLAQANLETDPVVAGQICGFAANRLERWDVAVKVWKDLVDLKPDRPSFAYQAAAIESRLGNAKEAAEFCLHILTCEPTNDAALRLLLQQYVSLKDKTAVEAFAAKMAKVKIENISPALLAKIIQASEKLGLHSQFKEWVGLGMSHSKPEDRTRAQYARLLYKEKNFETSEKEWMLLVDADPASVRAFEPRVFLARCAEKRGDHGTALQRYREALNLAPNNQDILEALILVLIRLQKFEEAGKEIEILKSIAPDSIGAMAMDVTVGYRLGDPAEIERRCNEAVARFAYTPLALFRLGRIIRSQNDTERVKEHWQHCLALNPEDTTLLISKIEDDLMSDPDYPDIHKYLIRLFAINPIHELGLLYNARVCRLLGRIEEAKESYLVGGTHFPDNLEFTIGSASLLMDADKVTEAMVLYDDANERMGSVPEAARTLARLATAVDRPELAHAHYSRALELAPNDIPLWRSAVRFQADRGAFGIAWNWATQARQYSRNEPIIASTLVSSASLLSLSAPGWWKSEEREIEHLRSPNDIFPLIAHRRWRQPDRTGHKKNAILVTSSLGSGGAERQVAMTMAAFKEANHRYDEITLAVGSLDPNRKHDFFLSDAVKSGHTIVDLSNSHVMDLIRQLGEDAVHHREAIRIAAALPVHVASLTLPLLGLFLQKKPDVVHLWQDTVNIAGGIAGILAGVPKIIMGTRSSRPDSRRRLRDYLLPGYQSLLAVPGVEILNNSQYGAYDYEDWLGLDADSVSCVHNGFRVAHLREVQHQIEAPMRDLGIPHDAFVLGGVMRFSEEKRPRLFIETALRLVAKESRIHVVLVGDGPLRNELIEKVRASEFADRIHLPGAKSPVEPWMKGMSVLMLTSRMEGLPNVLVEAQVLGVPVVAVNVGGVPETMIAGTTGIPVKSDSPDALSAAVMSLFKDPARRKEMGAAAAIFSERNFGLKRMIEKTIDIYEQPDRTK